MEYVTNISSNIVSTVSILLEEIHLVSDITLEIPYQASYNLLLLATLVFWGF